MNQKNCTEKMGKWNESMRTFILIQQRNTIILYREHTELNRFQKSLKENVSILYIWSAHNFKVGKK